MDIKETTRERAMRLNAIDKAEEESMKGEGLFGAYSYFFCGRFPSEAAKDIMSLLIANGTTQEEFKTIIDILQHNYEKQFAREKIKEVEE